MNPVRSTAKQKKLRKSQMLVSYWPMIRISISSFAPKASPWLTQVHLPEYRLQDIRSNISAKNWAVATGARSGKQKGGQAVENSKRNTEKKTKML
jgi:hypothetical protein